MRKRRSTSSSRRSVTSAMVNAWSVHDEHLWLFNVVLAVHRVLSDMDGANELNHYTELRVPMEALFERYPDILRRYG